ncbi:testis-expressed protein 19.2-like [Chionomys nivalis]|uniref:testis-expressed protein 19.2-like n=1 Tax=Chionomys nivalis TaxID=269649 RepID=UPI002594C3A0|nr:testis-expressed protein 19.2-like [Chionomys nivalis]
MPEEAVLLDARPEDYDRYWAFPWKLGRFSPCPHQCTIPPLSFCDIFNVDPHPDEPLLLELSHIWPTNKLVESCLKEQNFFLVLCGSGTGWYLVSMYPLWVVRTQVHRWQMMLNPDALVVIYLETGPEKQDMNRWKLSMLESSELGLELVPADCTLWKKGFKVHSYLPWQSETLKDWGKEPGERLFVKHVRILKNY